MNLTRTRWAKLKPAERTRTAKAVAKQLPTGFAFDAVRVCKLGMQKNAVAFFTSGKASFALIPGGRVTVGYDATRPWTPTADEEESWGYTTDEYDLGGSIRKFIARVTRRPKAITVPPLLVETVAGEIGWEPIARDAPEVRQLLREHSDARTITAYTADGTIRVHRGRGKHVRAERVATGTHGERNALLKRSGFRFPTADEWEYLCGAGADTLFRWGDHAPCDRYPLGTGRKDVERQPNAFGLRIAQNPYRMELTATPGRQVPLVAGGAPVKALLG